MFSVYTIDNILILKSNSTVYHTQIQIFSLFMYVAFLFEPTCLCWCKNTMLLEKLIFCLSAMSWPQSMRSFSGITQRIGNVKSILVASVMSRGLLA